MSAAYLVSGLFLGFMAGRTTVAEPFWAALIIPAALCLIAGWCLEGDRRA